MTKRINLISGPRNISTALMYSFANREDTEVFDEPMYGFYLAETKIDYHPGSEQVLKEMPTTMDEVKTQIIFRKVDRPIYFLKGMAHHFVTEDYAFILDLKNLFLIRNPYQLIASFAQVIETPTMLDIGLKREWELCNYLIENGVQPLVLDSNTILSDPKSQIRKLCAALEIPFSEKMLSWEKGPIPQDGSWAKYWYKNVWESTGFKKQATSSRVLPEHLTELYEESLHYFNLLKQYELK